MQMVYYIQSPWCSKHNTTKNTQTLETIIPEMKVKQELWDKCVFWFYILH